MDGYTTGAASSTRSIVIRFLPTARNKPVGSHMIPFGILYLLAIGLSRKLTINRAFGAAVFGALGLIYSRRDPFHFPEADMNKRLGALILPHLVIDALLVPILFRF